MKKVIYAAMISTAIVATSCGNNKPERTSGIRFSDLDTTVSPTEDFYQYACGGWMKNHPLTAEYARYGSFDKLAEDNQEQLKGLITEIAKDNHKKGSIPQKIADLYNLGMDSVTIEKQGAEPLKGELQSIAAMSQKRDLTNKLAAYALEGGSPLFAIFGEANPNNSSERIAWVWQTGLGIGDRDYYLDNSAHMETIRKEYVTLLSKFMQLSGYDKEAKIANTDEMAKRILAFETELAKAFMDKNDTRDPYKTCNIVSVDEWQKMLPIIDLKSYMNTIGLGAIKSVNVGQVEYTKSLNKILEKTDLEVLKAYLACNYVNGAASYLSNAFVDANFHFYGRVLSGREEQRPRWKRVVGTVDESLGEAVGQMYVE